MEEKARNSADAALEGAKRQVEEQRQLLREAKVQLASSQEQLAALKKILKETQKLKGHVEKLRVEAEKAKVEVEKARDKAEQHGYEVGMAKTEDTLRGQVPAVCRTYRAQTWEEALNRAGVEASSELKRPENIYFPLAIRASTPPFIQGDVASTVIDLVQEAQPQDPLPLNQPEQPKEPEVSKDTSSNKTVEVPQDGAASQGFEQALALTTMPAEEAFKDKKETIPTKVDKPTNKTSKLQIKLKQ